MATKKLVVSANAGFMPFDLYSLHDLYTNLKDKNYWTAFRKAIRILDDMVNPETGRTNARVWEDATGEQIDECCEKLEEWVNEQSETLRTDPASVTVNKKLSEPNADAVPIVEIITLVNLVLQFIGEWRKRRNRPEGHAAQNRERDSRMQSRSPAVASARSAGSPGFNSNPHETTAMATNKDGSVNRPAGVTNDQPAPAATDPRDESGKSLPVTNDTNTKADTLAGRQTEIPEGESAESELDRKKQAERAAAGEDDSDDDDEDDTDVHGKPKESDAARKLRENQAKQTPPGGKKGNTRK